MITILLSQWPQLRGRKGIGPSHQQQLHAARAVRRRGGARGAVQRRPLRGVAAMEIRGGVQEQRHQVQPDDRLMFFWGPLL